jgi:hypothetical protein
MGFSGFPFDPKGSSLGRTIGQILDHGIRPTFLSSFVAASLDSRQQEFYGSDSLLDPRYLDQPVAYQTTYSSSRWGSRVLTTDEIGIAFGLPTRLSLGGLKASMFPFVPLQVLSGCLDSKGDMIIEAGHWTPKVSGLQGLQKGLLFGPCHQQLLKRLWRNYGRPV